MLPEHSGCGTRFHLQTQLPDPGIQMLARKEPRRLRRDILRSVCGAAFFSEPVQYLLLGFAYTRKYESFKHFEIRRGVNHRHFNELISPFSGQFMDFVVVRSRRVLRADTLSTIHRGSPRKRGKAGTVLRKEMSNIASNHSTKKSSKPLQNFCLQ